MYVYRDDIYIVTNCIDYVNMHIYIYIYLYMYVWIYVQIQTDTYMCIYIQFSLVLYNIYYFLMYYMILLYIILYIYIYIRIYHIHIYIMFVLYLFNIYIYYICIILSYGKLCIFSASLHQGDSVRRWWLAMSRTWRVWSVWWPEWRVAPAPPHGDASFSVCPGRVGERATASQEAGGHLFLHAGDARE